MSRGRRERRAEQGQGGEGFTGYYGNTVYGPSLLRELEEEEGLYPGALRCHKVWTWGRVNVVGGQRPESFLFDAGELVDFIRYVCPRLQERRDLQVTTGRLHKENERLKRELQCAQRRASEAEWEASEASDEMECLMVGNENLQEQKQKLQQELSEAERGIVEAQRNANEARVEASSLHEKLRETDAAFTEAKKKFISAPDLVPCLQSLAAEVKTLQETVRTNGERTAELMTTRPAEGRRTVKTLHQMKRVLHDIGRFPRRRRARATDAADDDGGAIKRGRICYVCRCKGHLAKDCPQARINAVESVDPTISDAQQREGEPNTEASSSSGWTIFSALRRFTSGID